MMKSLKMSTIGSSSLYGDGPLTRFLGSLGDPDLHILHLGKWKKVSRMGNLDAFLDWYTKDILIRSICGDMMRIPYLSSHDVLFGIESCKWDNTIGEFNLAVSIVPDTRVEYTLMVNLPLSDFRRCLGMTSDETRFPLVRWFHRSIGR